jgi:hypothetical protein
MKRIDKELKAKLLAGIEENISINKLHEQFHLPKTTIYYYMKKIRGLKYSTINLEFSDEELGELLGTFIGDGSFSLDLKKGKYRITFSLGGYEQQYAEDLQTFFTKIFHKKPYLYHYPKSNVILLRIHSKSLYNLVIQYVSWNVPKSHSVLLKKTAPTTSQFYIGFLRGLLDTDGGVYRPKKKVAFGTASKQLALQIQKALLYLGFSCGFYAYKNKEFYYLDLYGERSVNLIKLIRPRNNRRLLTRL